ncbi:acyl-CoA dehydrogenase [Rhodococcus ruber Chol-4]|uniref:acyl-CoA dehydrogenase family protein n=1 Tax=Rhodococcus TaxID=1827 RepID=UPI00034AD003|nr:MULTISPECIES: acyl-CoA dehydrogenase family protein [Rhodococcus]MDO2377294.1 acyl-CoA dehydrogenase family protein [Rhodococcus ruber]MDX5311215.1 acyl-CoA/acyl-ACP dehydrogenase [Rhodococcus sp. (in: high G+C Gram-positive bacteria)]RIK13986.1 MAG: acyl-CoA dehydrogenase [Acidobacteriota bacterium]AWG97622.1 acyl-CoA dehydrogenase [Rhodococcus ruber]AXY50340.1 acyl-CoA dehydrogenase [Rhodococcus ruber]
MDFARDDTQEAVAEVAVGLLARGLGPDELWRALADADLLSLALPARLGGDDLGVAEVAALLTEIGRGAAPVPALATLGFGVLPVRTLATAAQQDELLADVGDGAVLTAALAEAGRAFPASPTATAVPDGERHAVTGHFVGVPYAATARRILVPTAAGVIAVEPTAPGVTLIESPSSARAPEFSVRLDSAPGLRLGDGAEPAADVAALYRLALAAVGAYADGLLSGATQLTAQHVSTRHQFGRPLATFQAVAQQIADVYVTSRTLHVAALAAAWRVAQDARSTAADDDLDVAAYWIAAELPPAMGVLHHLHGGLGVDETYPLHRYSSTAKDLARLLGGASYRLDLVGARCSST